MKKTVRLTTAQAIVRFLDNQYVSMDGEERRAMIRGALSAAFLVLGVLAAAFAGLIFLIGNVWG